MPLYLIHPDEDPDFSKEAFPKYRYSDELFEWFYSRVMFFSSNSHEFEEFEFDEKRTKEDNSEDGCRIWLADSGYIKFYDTSFLMEFQPEEWKKIEDHVLFPLTMSGIVDAFYKINEKQ